MSLPPIASSSSAFSQQDTLGGKGEEVTSAWKLELEQAQWAYLSGEGRPASSNPVSDYARSTAPTPSVSRAQGPQVAQHVPSAAEKQAESDGGGITLTAKEMPVGAQIASNDEKSSSLAAAPSMLDTDSPAGEPPEVSPANPKYPLRSSWPQVSVLAYAGEDGTAVWVRDASLDADDYRKLTCELRARLGSMGQRLSSLTVNGESAMPVLETGLKTIVDYEKVNRYGD
jgi:hypothetical protein